MTKDELKELGVNIANSLVDLSLNSNGDEWRELDNDDHMLGDLAKFMTLKNVYLEREEYEKIIPIQIKLDELNKKLGMEEEGFEEETEEDNE
jgi:hypothetical protein